MNFPWPGGLFIALLLLQDPAPVRPDLAAKFAAILESGPESRRELAARALLSLGRGGHAALRRVLAAKPELAKAGIQAGDAPPALAMVRVATDEDALWQSLDTDDAPAAARRLRELYAAPPDAPPGRASAALRAALDRTRDFDLSDRSLAAFLADEPISWILMSPRDERVTLKLRGATLRDFFRIATPKLAAVPVGDLLLLIPADRVAAAAPAGPVWATSDLAPRIEAAIDALARGDDGPVNGVTGVGLLHALIRAGFGPKAEAVRRQLEQRVYFIEPGPDEGKPVTCAPAGATAQSTAAAFEKAAGLKLEILTSARLDGAPPAFRFRNIPASLAARALGFRLNHIY